MGYLEFLKKPLLRVRYKVIDFVRMGAFEERKTLVAVYSHPLLLVSFLSSELVLIYLCLGVSGRLEVRAERLLYFQRARQSN